MISIFDKRAVNATRDALRRLFRLILYKHKISDDDFVRMHTTLERKLGRPTEIINSNRQNYRKAIKSDGEMTFNRFMFFLSEIFRFNIIRISVTIKNPDGTETTYHSDEVAD